MFIVFLKYLNASCSVLDRPRSIVGKRSNFGHASFVVPACYESRLRCETAQLLASLEVGHSLREVAPFDMVPEHISIELGFRPLELTSPYP